VVRRWWKLLLGLAAIPIAVWGCDRFQRIAWVGSTDLEIKFIITDADTGQPIESAQVAVHSEGGFYREHEEPDFTLVTDGEGIARRVCHRSMCFGTQSLLRFTNTFAVHLPWWHFSVSAPGYETNDLVYLNVPEYRRQVERGRPGATLIVRAALRKVPAAQLN
jgi:hypothetical protein